VFDLVEGRERKLSVEDLDYGYRRSAVLGHHVVTEAEFHLAAGDPERGRETIRDIVRWRRENQPGGQNAGSVFTNPPGDSAGRLIDAAGLKGHRIGTAEVSTKHANFIQADADGSADDVFALIRLIRGEVARRFGVDLHPEVRLIGFPPEPSSGALELQDEEEAE
jgi:UDP-N-acetylmuramate dehydrogenase